MDTSEPGLWPKASHRLGIDYSDIFSPVVRYETVRLMLAIAALQNWHMSSVDVKTAFLYGKLDEELYMEQPEGFKRLGQERKVMRLKRVTIIALGSHGLSFS